MEREKFRKLLFTIDEALSSLPFRLGRIRQQHSRNCLGETPALSSVGDSVEETSMVLTSRDDSDPQKMNYILQKMAELTVLVKRLKENQMTPLEVLGNNQLMAISALKKEIQETKREIEVKNSSDGSYHLISLHGQFVPSCQF